MSVEKFFALYFPLKTKSICTAKTAKWATLVTALIFLTYEFQYFFIVEAYTKTDGYGSCRWIGVSDSYLEIMYKLDSAIYSFFPFTTMFLANCAIIYKFMMAKWQAKRRGTESTSQALSKSAVKGTAMLVTVSITFILLTGPVSFAWVITSTIHPYVLVIIYPLSYLNHAINGILYCIVGSRFRNELINTLCCRKAFLSHRLSTLVGSRSNNTSNTNVSSTGSPI